MHGTSIKIKTRQFRYGCEAPHIDTTQQPHVSAYTSCDIQHQNVAPDDGLKSPKHVEHLMTNKNTL